MATIAKTQDPQEYFGPAQCTVIAVLGLSNGTC
eukprot:CAMPEP_0172158462 /NCGR_PEP_ID=MMETSP1050-20130122/4386_1 /TAXON_ID=233186 /ORGANISM="Cryptomonas curvata, Strain CCAP979/52" /LENGTH=32 /DNA_ID= /DNA_START= /DNA_END= /DNA_ORIENTATION=